MKPNTKIYINWLFWNGIVVILTYLALVQGVQGAANVVMFFIWFGALMSTTFLTSTIVETIAKRYKHAPQWYHKVDVLFDLLFTCFLLWYAWYFTAAAYMVSVMFTLAAKKEAGLIKD